MGSWVGNALGVLLVIGLLLGLLSCQPGLTIKQRSQVADMIADQLPEDESARISDLEERIAELEGRLN